MGSWEADTLAYRSQYLAGNEGNNRQVSTCVIINDRAVDDFSQAQYDGRGEELTISVRRSMMTRSEEVPIHGYKYRGIEAHI
ncbi:MAG: hypothetical protein GDA43_00790 [Hormoscilla sp. SP5CHS1]|nr:hypothetical protein [Hormoscilla sp. SP12CHS1]MBC6451901.1 hypothetical protein [Hormoscilla sp. SP5CHS1]